MIHIIVCDDHPIVRSGLKRMLDDEPDMQVDFETSNAIELFEALKKYPIDILVLDISMPGISGFEALSKIKSLYPNIKVLMLSALSEDLYALKTIKAGASGFLNKESSPEELVKAVRKIIAGGIYVSEIFVDKLAFDFKNNYKKLPHERLSEREFQIFSLIGAGKRVGEIADKLFISAKTVSTYRSRILEKMEFKHNSDIIKYCIKEGIVQ